MAAAHLHPCCVVAWRAGGKVVEQLGQWHLRLLIGLYKIPEGG